MTAAHHALQQYGKQAVKADLSTASPHRIISLLLDKAITELLAARLCITNKAIEAKAIRLNNTLDIITALQLHLDMSQGGEIAPTLNKLYDYIQRSLLTINKENNVNHLDEIVTLLREIKLGWKDIG